MGASLVLVLLLAAVASAHATSPVSFENKCGKPVKLDGIVVLVDAKVVLNVDVKVAVLLSVVGVDGKEYSKKFFVPADVKALVLVYDGVYIKVKVAALNLLVVVVGLVKSVIGLVVGELKVALFVRV